ncbi:3,6-diketocamphane 1,6 monooxygenase [Pigmentiphaga humi]|uniref:3,6-diketocamphane 1,6 monooxygenase n=1 Tax=Pigmentiphaga humi TaxID=2478468 RepID=A0A3P4B1P4_9BURK|nr:LLM class flavin-dependent oxidoreductase [Pigmentiphaga humi]VCU69620.1 3,6-diketocamphane 1,6 monooxygenase [Pigmentiphaga humi]
MKLGMFMMPLHPPGRPMQQTLQEDREAILLAEALGYAEAFVGEHVTDAAETVSSCIAFLASVACQTRRIKLGTGTCNLPNQHPAHIAAQVAMLDHLSGGRVLFGISPGGLMSDAEMFDSLDKNRNEMFVESIDMILELWRRDPPYDIRGKYWSASTARTQIPEIGQGIVARPLQAPHPPIVGTAVAPYSQGVLEMAKRGWSPISANFLLPKWVATHWPKFVEGRQAAGLAASPQDWRVAKSIFVADDRATAQRYALGADGPYAFYFRQLMRKLVGGGNRGNLFKPDPAMPDADLTLDFVLRNLVIAGTVDDVAEQLLAFREQVGDFGTLLYACHDWQDAALGKRSMELMAREVLPRVNAAVQACA